MTRRALNEGEVPTLAVALSLGAKNRKYAAALPPNKSVMATMIHVPPPERRLVCLASLVLATAESWPSSEKKVLCRPPERASSEKSPRNS